MFYHLLFTFCCVHILGFKMFSIFSFCFIFSNGRLVLAFGHLYCPRNEKVFATQRPFHYDLFSLVRITLVYSVSWIYINNYVRCGLPLKAGTWNASWKIGQPKWKSCNAGTENQLKNLETKPWMPPMRFLDSWVFVDPKYKGLQGIVYIQHTTCYFRH